MTNRLGAAVMLAGVVGCASATHAPSAPAPLPPGWRVAEPSESIAAGTFALRAPAKSDWLVKVSADDQTVVFRRRSENVGGQLLFGGGPRVHDIKVQRGTVPANLAKVSDSGFVADSLFDGLLTSGIRKDRLSKVKRSSTRVDDRTVYRLEHNFTVYANDLRDVIVINDLSFVDYRGLALVCVVHPPEGPRIWYLVDGDVGNVQGGMFSAKPDEEMLRAMLLSIAETQPHVAVMP